MSRLTYFQSNWEVYGRSNIDDDDDGHELQLILKRTRLIQQLFFSDNFPVVAHRYYSFIDIIYALW